MQAQFFALQNHHEQLQKEFTRYQEVTSTIEMLEKYVPYVLRINEGLAKKHEKYRIDENKALYIVHVIHKHCAIWDVPLELAFRHFAWESSFCPTIRNLQNGEDYGLGQINKGTLPLLARKVAYERVVNPFDIEKNVAMSLCYLSDCLAISDGDWHEALARYNAGRYWKTHGMAHAGKVLSRQTAF